MFFLVTEENWDGEVETYVYRRNENYISHNVCNIHNNYQMFIEFAGKKRKKKHSHGEYFFCL